MGDRGPLTVPSCGRIFLRREYIAAVLSNQRIACAAPAAGPPVESTASDGIVDVAQGGILGAPGQYSPFRRGELAFDPIQQAIDDGALPVIECRTAMLLPEARESAAASHFEAREAARTSA